MIKYVAVAFWATIFAGIPTAANAAYLNQQNTTIKLGPSMAQNPFENRSAIDSLASIIDAPSAIATEFHNQSTHVWVSGGLLELVFDFQAEYDLTKLHFWNYHSENFDVDEIDFKFYDANNSLVGTLLGVTPALGGSTGNDSTPIVAQDYSLLFPSKARYVNAVLSGSNGEVDFNNIGFTGTPSNPPTSVPEASTSAGLIPGILLMAAMLKR
jgi:hypothetical protein